VDLAAANGGNVAQTQPDELITTDNGVKNDCIGWNDPSCARCQRDFGVDS
jgi:NAD/NADP transhydrogenase alpha subunit